MSAHPGEELLALALHAELVEHLSATILDRDAIIEHLRTALVNCRSIGAAVGILMITHKLTQDAAFADLVSSSQNLNRKLTAVAVYVTETGELPERNNF